MIIKASQKKKFHDDKHPRMRYGLDHRVQTFRPTLSPLLENPRAVKRTEQSSVTQFYGIEVQNAVNIFAAFVIFIIAAAVICYIF